MCWSRGTAQVVDGADSRKFQGVPAFCCGTRLRRYLRPGGYGPPPGGFFLLEFNGLGLKSSRHTSIVRAAPHASGGRLKTYNGTLHAFL